ncbi:Response regulator protein TodT [compost metagenome]
MRSVVKGFLNKQIAFELSISEVTVKLHRSSMMRKMKATSTAQLFGAWQSLPADIRMNDG